MRDNRRATVLTIFFVVSDANRGIALNVAEVCLTNLAKFVYSWDINDLAGESTKPQEHEYLKYLKYLRADIRHMISIEERSTSIYDSEGRPA